MYKIYYDNSQFVVMVDGEQNSDGKIELDTSKTYILTLLPIYDKTLFLPISSTARIKNSNLECSIPHIKIDSNQYYLIPKFAPYLPPHSPRVDMQREFGEHTITVYTDNVPKLLIENKSNFISVILPDFPKKMQEAVLDDGILFYCLCDKYLCVVFYDYNDYTVLIDKECESYTFDESGINFRIELNDNQGRVYSCHLTFDGKEYVPDSESFEYLTPHIPHKKLIGYDFLQAIMADDIEYAKKWLSPNCPKPVEEIAELFENCSDIIIPNCPITKNNIFVLSGGNIKKCHFSVSNGMIENIQIF